MELEFLGVGEAFEPQLGNASFLLKSPVWIMIDYGYGVPSPFFERGYSADAVDAIYFTHFHADHLFGLAALLSYWEEEKRSKPLTLIGQPGMENTVTQLLELDCCGMQAKLPYSLYFIESESHVTFGDCQLHFAATLHSVKNLAVKIEIQGLRIGISEDGDLTEASQQLFHDCHLLIHDAFYLKEPFKGHATAESVVSFARSLSQLKTLALVHISRKERVKNQQAFLELGKNCPFELIIPQSGTRLELSSNNGSTQSVG